MEICEQFMKNCYDRHHYEKYSEMCFICTEMNTAMSLSMLYSLFKYLNFLLANELERIESNCNNILVTSPNFWKCLSRIKEGGRIIPI